MRKSAYEKAMNTAVPEYLVQDARRWMCSNCGSTDVTVEWEFDKNAPLEDIVWEGKVYREASYKKWVQRTEYHEATCPEIAHERAGVDRTQLSRA